jgi:hypothetical protein
MQVAAGGLLILAGVIGLLLSTLTRTYVHQATVAAIAQRSPSLAPEQVSRLVDFSVGVGIAVAMVIGVVYLVLGALTLFALKDWTFYADLVVFCLMGLGGIASLAGIAGGTAGPLAFSLPNLLLGLAALAMFGWMLWERVRVGPWACRRTTLYSA